MRALIVVLSVALLGVAAPVSDLAAVPVPDRVLQLAGEWTCVSGYHEGGRLTFQADRDGMVSTHTSLDRARDSAITTHFIRNAGGGWTIERRTAFATYRGTAPAWTEAVWPIAAEITFAGRGQTPSPRTERYELLDSGALRLTALGTGGYVTSAELCTRGTAVPDASVCVTPNLPARTLFAAEPDITLISRRVSGTVLVLVSIDADSNVSGARVLRTDSALLNASALDAARRSRFQTVIKDCKAIPGDYVFSVNYQL